MFFTEKTEGTILTEEPGRLHRILASRIMGRRKEWGRWKNSTPKPKPNRSKKPLWRISWAGCSCPGESIPSQSDYAKQYGVSRLTVRKAIDDLVAKGILWTEQGKGTFVQELAVNAHSYRRVSGFSSNVASGKVHTHSKVISIQELPADVRLSRHLQIPQGAPVVLIERLRYINQVCVCFQRSFLVKERGSAH